MQRYIALLRGINVGGKNKIPMKELKRCFEQLNFVDVCTHLQSGNVIFSTDATSIETMRSLIEKQITESFNLHIPVLIVSVSKLKDAFMHAPTWWNTDDATIYDNLICLFPGVDSLDFYQRIGLPNEALEKVACYKDFIFWSFVKKDHQKSTWWKKTASDPFRMQITIRTANTIKKIVNM